MNRTVTRLPISEKKSIRNGVEMPIECLLREVVKDGGRKLHYHDYIEFLFGLAPCDVNAELAGQRIRLGEGDLLVINANVAHDFHHMLQKNRYICIKVLPEVIYFSENPMYDVKYVVPFLQHNLNPYCLFPREVLEGSEIPKTLFEMLQSWQAQEYGYEIDLKSLLLRVFLWIIRQNHQNGSGIMEPAADISFENTVLIQRSIEYINDNYADLNEVQVAAFANMSYSYYCKLFKRVVGQNFNDYLTTVRINEAERLLLSTDLSVTDIGLAAGFSSGSHFIEKFKKHRGKTPKQYRLYRS